MNTFKRTLAIVLTVCMVCAFVVPAVSAEAVTGNVYFNQYPGFASSAKPSTSNGDYVTGSTVSSTEKGYVAKYVISSNTSINLRSQKNIGIIYETTVDNIGEWVAFEITNVPSGKYVLSAATHASWYIHSGKFDVYLMPSMDYMNMEASAMQSTIGANLIADNKVGTYEGISNQAIDIGYVEFAEDANYIMVFKVTGKGASATGTNAYFVSTAAVLTANATGDSYVTIGGASAPVEEDVIDINGEKKTASEAAAAINAATSGKITLLGDLELDADIYVAPGVTLDLAGNKLTANVSVADGGALIDMDPSAEGYLAADRVNFNGDNGGYLPLLTQAGGYVFAKVTSLTKEVTGKTADSANFWFDFDFYGFDVYAEDVVVGVDFTYTGAGVVSAEPDDDVMADFLAAWANKTAEQDIKLSVTGLEGVEGFELTPYIKANGVKIYASAIALG